MIVTIGGGNSWTTSVGSGVVMLCEGPPSTDGVVPSAFTAAREAAETTTVSTNPVENSIMPIIRIDKNLFKNLIIEANLLCMLLNKWHTYY